MSRKVCSVDGCEKQVHAKGLCGAHYYQYLKYGDPLCPDHRKTKPYRICSVEGCNRKHYGHGFCEKHMRHWKKYGDPLHYESLEDGFAKQHEKEWQSWGSMKQRCTNKNACGYKNYGGRGVKICDRWLDPLYGFKNFYKDMGERLENTSLDRINVDGDYCKENCRWATPKEQNRNRRNNAVMTRNGETHTLTEWSEILNLNYGMLSQRRRYGWPESRLFNPPTR